MNNEVIKIRAVVVEERTYPGRDGREARTVVTLQTAANRYRVACEQGHFAKVLGKETNVYVAAPVRQTANVRGDRTFFDTVISIEQGTATLAAPVMALPKQMAAD